MKDLCRLSFTCTKSSKPKAAAEKVVKDKLDAQEAFILRLVEEQKDISLQEIADRLAETRCVRAT